jgi:predicted MPP superfamily phosphohydrolase
MLVRPNSEEAVNEQFHKTDFLRLGGGVLITSALAGAGTIPYARLVEPQHLVLERRTIRLPRLSAALDGFRIALMSDHHLFPFTPKKLLEHATQETNALRPDLILLVGDYVCKDVESIRELSPILGRLNAKYGVFAVLGNYDRALAPNLVCAQLRAQSIEVLINRGLHTGPSAGQLFLTGLDSVCKGVPDPIRAFAAYRKGDVAIALVHEPDYFSTMVQLTPVDLQLSGHSHGGQVRFPALDPLILPKWGQIYHTGLYKVGDRVVYTGRGRGLVELPLRLGCPPEMTEITLAA